MEDGMEELVQEVSSVRSEVEGLKDQVAGGLAGLYRSLEEARSESSIEVIDVASELGDLVRGQIEMAVADLCMEFSSLQTVHFLMLERVRGYQFFGAHTEQWSDDPEIAKFEPILRRIAGTPIVASALDRNRAELEAWREMGMHDFDLSAISREEFVERAEHVLQCAGEEITVDPVECIWTVLAADGEFRRQQRLEHHVPPSAA